MSNSVLVIGSANQDTVVHLSRLPLTGETITGSSVSFLPGGKGLNQACASSCAGMETRFLGALGKDSAGEQLLDTLTDNGVNASYVLRVGEEPTGSAYILVNENGDNQIVVIRGANQKVTTNYVNRHIPNFGDTRVLVLQGEIPMDTNLSSAEYASRVGIRTILNLAPATGAPPRLLELADPLVVNEFEAAQIANVDVPQTSAEALGVASTLAENSRSVVITLGAAGAVVMETGEGTVVTTNHVASPVDTTGAGDAFVGVLAAQLAQGIELADAASNAVQAATSTVMYSGAAASYGSIREFFRQASQ